MKINTRSALLAVLILCSCSGSTQTVKDVKTSRDIDMSAVKTEFLSDMTNKVDDLIDMKVEADIKPKVAETIEAFTAKATAELDMKVGDISGRVGTFESRIGRAITEMRASLTAALDAHVEAFTAKFSANATTTLRDLDSRIGTIEAKIGSVDTRVGTLEQKNETNQGPALINFATSGSSMVPTAVAVVLLVALWICVKRGLVYKSILGNTARRLGSHDEKLVEIMDAASEGTIAHKVIKRHCG
ncbi:MAG: hypothetical protein MI923_16195 [Phycisphaerales bacterium]|nr:hypothetical protein [Phycisphaerales bacterium]